MLAGAAAILDQIKTPRKKIIRSQCSVDRQHVYEMQTDVSSPIVDSFDQQTSCLSIWFNANVNEVFKSNRALLTSVQCPLLCFLQPLFMSTFLMKAEEKEN